MCDWCIFLRNVSSRVIDVYALFYKNLENKNHQKHLSSVRYSTEGLLFCCYSDENNSYKNGGVYGKNYFLRVLSLKSTTVYKNKVGNIEARLGKNLQDSAEIPKSSLRTRESIPFFYKS